MGIVEAIIVASVSSQAAPLVVQAEREVPRGFGYAQLAEGRDTLAVEDILTNGVHDSADPARLINLGIAYARLGRVEEARALFERARTSNDMSRLETADGEWLHARQIASRALALIDNGEFEARARMAAR